MTLPIITGLSSDLIPHEQWAWRRWLYARGGPYYHGPGHGWQIITNPRSYRLIDPLLRPVCRLLHQHGVATVPSCEGHSHPRERYERTWKSLLRDANTIRNDGLVVRDSTTCETFLFRDPHYILPWTSMHKFTDRAMEHQRTGYLGLVVPVDNSDLYERLRTIRRDVRGAMMYFDERALPGDEGWLFHIIVRTGNARERAARWRRVTHTVYEAVQATSPALAVA